MSLIFYQHLNKHKPQSATQQKQYGRPTGHVTITTYKSLSLRRSNHLLEVFKRTYIIFQYDLSVLYMQNWSYIYYGFTIFLTEWQQANWREIGTAGKKIRQLSGVFTTMAAHLSIPEDLKVPPDLFKDVKYYLIGNIHEKVSYRHMLADL